MFFKGTPTRGVGEIAKQTKASGGYLNAHTIYDHTAYYTVLPSSGFAKGLDIQADAYANSLIDADELAKEIEVIIQEAKRKADNPSAVATETLYELLHDAHRIRRWRIGREPGLRAFTRDEMNRFYRNFYRPGNTILSIVGDVDPDDALRRVTDAVRRAASGRAGRNPGPSEPDRDGLPLSRAVGRHRADAARARLENAGHARSRHARFSTSPRRCSATGRASRLYRVGARDEARVVGVGLRLHADRARRVRRARGDRAREHRGCRARDLGSAAPARATERSKSTSSSACAASSRRGGCDGSRPPRAAPTIWPSGKRWATGAWERNTSSGS